MEGKDSRLIALIDMDAFYAQVEVRDRPELLGKPVAIVQYNQVKHGGLIAVSYEARAGGVKRYMRADEATKVCPELNLVSTPTTRDKADLTKYRQASAEVFQVLNAFSPLITVEKASIDEAYLDLTKLVDSQLSSLGWDDGSGVEVDEAAAYPSTFVLSSALGPGEAERAARLEAWVGVRCADEPGDLRLALAARLVESVRARILEETRFHCSAGIANCKTLAKLICSRHKPRQQTVLCPDYLHSLYDETPIAKVRNLGGKLGAELSERYGENMGDLFKVPKDQLLRDLGAKTGGWLHGLLLGSDWEEVQPKDASKSIGSSKNFVGKATLTRVEDLRLWTANLAADLQDRLKEDAAKLTLTVHYRCPEPGHKWGKGISKVCPLPSSDEDAIAGAAFGVLRSALGIGSEDVDLPKAVIHIGMSAGKFLAGAKGSHSILGFTMRAGEATLNESEAPGLSPPGVSSEPPAKRSHPMPSMTKSEDRLCDTNEDVVTVDGKAGPPDESGWVSAESGLCAVSLADVDAAVWAQLSPKLQFEIRAQFRRQEPATAPMPPKPPRSASTRPNAKSLANKSTGSKHPITNYFAKKE